MVIDNHDTHTTFINEISTCFALGIRNGPTSDIGFCGFRGTVFQCGSS